MLKADWWSAPLDAAARARGKIAGSSIPLNAAGRLHQSDKMRRGSPGITAKNAGRELSNSITILMQPGSTSIYRHSPAILLLPVDISANEASSMCVTCNVVIDSAMVARSSAVTSTRSER